MGICDYFKQKKQEYKAQSMDQDMKNNVILNFNSDLKSIQDDIKWYTKRLAEFKLKEQALLNLLDNLQKL